MKKRDLERRIVELEKKVADLQNRPVLVPQIQWPQVPTIPQFPPLQPWPGTWPGSDIICRSGN